MFRLIDLRNLIQTIIEKEPEIYSGSFFILVKNESDMAENKTKPTAVKVEDFISSVTSEQKRADAKKLITLFERLTGEKAVMWGPSIIGFGQYHYKYASGREGDFMITGFSPRKTALTLYIMAGFSKYEEHLKKLGKFKTGKSCLYIKKLEDIDMDVLSEMILDSVQFIKERYPDQA